MKKLNGFESWLITEGLNILRNEWKNEIKLAETNNKIPIMVITETIDKIKALTLKQK